MRPIIYSGRPGAGKSKKTKENVFAIRGCHLYVVPTIPLLEEVRADLFRERLNHPHNECHIHGIHSNDGAAGGGNTFARIEDEADKYQADTDHCVFVIAQASFIELDLRVFSGWHLHIDEVLSNAVASACLHYPVMWTGLQTLFRLEPIAGEKHNALLVAHEGVAYKDVLADPAINDEVANLFQRCGGCRRIRGPKDALREKTRVVQTPVTIECVDLADIGQRKVSWYSFWSMRRACEHFASIEIAASDFELSMMYLIESDPVEVEWRPVPFGVSKAKIHLRYFNVGNRCDSTYWETPEGRQNLRLVGEYLKGKVEFWTSNSNIKEFLGLIIGEDTYVNPRIEGANYLWQKKSSAAIFSMKAQGHEAVLSKINPLLDRDLITKLREGSALWQFVMRGLPRNGNFIGDYWVFVYDQVQAEELEAKFKENLFPFVDIDHVKLPEFVDRKRGKPGPKTTMTVEDRREKTKSQNRARQQAFRSRKKAEKDS